MPQYITKEENLQPPILITVTSSGNEASIYFCIKGYYPQKLISFSPDGKYRLLRIAYSMRQRFEQAGLCFDKTGLLMEVIEEDDLHPEYKE